MYFSLYFNFLTRMLFSMADFTYLWLNLDFSSQIFQLCEFFSLNDQTFSYPGPTPCFCKVQDFWKIFFSNFLSYIRNYYGYLILILQKNWFDYILYMFPVKLIFHDLWAKAQVYIFIPQTFLQNQEFLKNIFFKLLSPFPIINIWNDPSENIGKSEKKITDWIFGNRISPISYYKISKLTSLAIMHPICFCLL